MALGRELVEGPDAEAGNSHDLLDAFYVRARMRRWFGAGEETGEALRIYPLYSLRGIQAAFALGPIRRHDEVLHFEITRRACDWLARLPFANASWAPGAVSAVADGEDYLKPPQKAAPAAPMAWQASRVADNRAVLETYLLDDPSNAVFEVVNRQAVETLLGRPDMPDGAGMQHLYGVLTAAVWLGHHEQPARIGTPPTAETG
jgi:hypothetical protein